MSNQSSDDFLQKDYDARVKELNRERTPLEVISLAGKDIVESLLFRLRHDLRLADLFTKSSSFGFQLKNTEQCERCLLKYANKVQQAWDENSRPSQFIYDINDEEFGDIQRSCSSTSVSVWSQAFPVIESHIRTIHKYPAIGIDYSPLPRSDANKFILSYRVNIDGRKHPFPFF